VSKLSERVKQTTLEMVRLYEPLSKHYIMMVYASTAISALMTAKGSKDDINQIKLKARQTSDLKRRTQFNTGPHVRVEAALDDLRDTIELVLRKYD
jgi:hypothetical protein